MSASFVAAGYADFSLIAFISKKLLFISYLDPVSYSIAMGVNALSAPLLGHLL